ncbi:hypothetical protein ABBQ32_004695 [Trebouxia sp. C0010 RCD-2024]
MTPGRQRPSISHITSTKPPSASNQTCAETAAAGQDELIDGSLVTFEAIDLIVSLLESHPLSQKPEPKPSDESNSQDHARDTGDSSSGGQERAESTSIRAADEA